MASDIAILALTKGGQALARRLARSLPATVFFCRGSLRRTMEQCWHDHDALVCIMAAGIVVRTLAPLIEDKQRDPAVVVCDEQGRFAVSLLSGHLGGGNELANRVAAVTGGRAVITTASDVQGKTALDLWARDLGLVVADRDGLTRAMGKLVNHGSVTLYSDYPLPNLPEDIQPTDQPQAADLIITAATGVQTSGTLLYARALVAGVGCNRNTPAEEIEQALQQACQENNFARGSVALLASIDLKRDEQGLLAFARRHGLPLVFFNKDELNTVDGVSTSAVVLRATGARGVAEPAAVLASDGGRLLVKKMKWPNVTVAIAEIKNPLGKHRFHKQNNSK